MKNNSKKKCGKAHLRPSILRPVRFTPKTAYNRGEAILCRDKTITNQ